MLYSCIASVPPPFRACIIFVLFFFPQIVVAVISTNSNVALCRACGVIKHAHTVEKERDRGKRRESEGDFQRSAEPDCCRYWKCFNSEPTPADEIVSWAVTKGHCGLITSSEMVSEFLCGVTHTLNRFHTFALIPAQSPR